MDKLSLNISTILKESECKNCRDAHTVAAVCLVENMGDCLGQTDGLSASELGDFLTIMYLMSTKGTVGIRGAEGQ